MGLQLETRDRLRIGAEEIVENLDRDDFVKDQIAGAVNDSHRAAINLAKHLETAPQFAEAVARSRLGLQTDKALVFLKLKAVIEFLEPLGHILVADVHFVDALQRIFGMK